MSTTKAQNLIYLRAHINDALTFGAPVSAYTAAICLNGLGGLMGSWRTDYSECTYYAPQRIGGHLVDLSDISKVRRFHELHEACASPLLASILECRP